MTARDVLTKTPFGRQARLAMMARGDTDTHMAATLLFTMRHVPDHLTGAAVLILHMIGEGYVLRVPLFGAAPSLDERPKPAPARYWQSSITAPPSAAEEAIASGRLHRLEEREEGRPGWRDFQKIALARRGPAAGERFNGTLAALYIHLPIQ